MLDAFSSDAIPMHLLTVEAMRTYAEHLAEDGLLVVHISNRVFDLEPVLRGAARGTGLAGAVGYGGTGEGRQASRWVVLSPSGDVTARLAASTGVACDSGARGQLDRRLLVDPRRARVAPARYRGLQSSST